MGMEDEVSNDQPKDVPRGQECHPVRRQFLFCAFS